MYSNSGGHRVSQKISMSYPQKAAAYGTGRLSSTLNDLDNDSDGRCRNLKRFEMREIGIW